MPCKVQYYILTIKNIITHLALIVVCDFILTYKCVALFWPLPTVCQFLHYPNFCMTSRQGIFSSYINVCCYASYILTNIFSAISDMTRVPTCSYKYLKKIAYLLRKKKQFSVFLIMLMKHLWTVGKTTSTTHDVFYQIE